MDIPLAIGLANGRIVLRSFNNTSSKELSPRTLRPCSGLHWSPLAPHNLLAAGLDRARGDGGVHVFDAESAPTTGTVFNATVQNRQDMSFETSY